jgi:hypothetical protein
VEINECHAEMLDGMEVAPLPVVTASITASYNRRHYICTRLMIGLYAFLLMHGTKEPSDESAYKVPCCCSFLNDII